MLQLNISHYSWFVQLHSSANGEAMVHNESPKWSKNIIFWDIIYGWPVWWKHKIQCKMTLEPYRLWLWFHPAAPRSELLTSDWKLNFVLTPRDSASVPTACDSTGRHVLPPAQVSKLQNSELMSKLEVIEILHRQHSLNFGVLHYSKLGQYKVT